MKFFVVVLLLLNTIVCIAQQVIQGVVLDKDAGPLPGATIYSPDLQSGKIADGEGRFEWQNLQPGKYLIQVSYVGYESAFRQIVVPSDSVITIKLNPSFIQMKDVVVTGAQIQSPDETTYQVEQIRAGDLKSMGALSISDAVSRIPGISQLTTGPGISKPVIRGLHGNRIQVNINGVRFDNQQWQDEHGLGLSDIGVERIEIIKGPASVLYGSDAIGGVLNIIEERPVVQGTTEKNIGVKLFSNTYGTSIRGGIRKATEKKWWHVNAGIESHSDYSDGNNYRVLNSRFANYSINAAMGKKKGKWVHANRLLTSFSQFGFVFDSITTIPTDNRLSRNYDGPHHQVLMAQLSSENTLFVSDKRKIKINGGVSTNLRQEDEGGGGISLSMLMNSGNLVWQTSQSISRFTELIYGASGFAQTNTNYGGRVIVPDAKTAEVSAFGFIKRNTLKWLLEGGLRVDQRWITTYKTKQLNTGTSGPGTDTEILPFSRSWQAMNASIGSTFRALEWISFKGNVSSGFRPGNLAELSSNGLHEGSLRWEIGLPVAKIEQNLNAEFSIQMHTSSLNATASVYNNQFRNYIYLAPTGLEYFGFNIYQFQQTNASIQGGEFQLDWALHAMPLELQSSYSMIAAKKEDGTYLPFIPANKISHEFKYHLPSKDLNAVVRLGGSYVFEQNHPAEFETSTPAYFILNAGAAVTIKKIDFALSATNLWNNVYFDHLSRFKYYGIYNMGRNIVLTMNFKL